MDGKVPILMSAAAGVRFFADNWRLALVLALAGAGASTLLSVGVMTAPAATIVLQVVELFLAATLYSIFLARALGRKTISAGQAAREGVRVLGAMASIGFFLLIVCVVMALPAIVIVSSAFTPFEDRVLALGETPDNDAAAQLFADAFAVNPWPFLGVVLAYGLVWMLLTSRLYAAAPASVDRGTIHAFTTWAWTKGNMLRILGARLVLLAPAAVIVVAIQRFAGAGLGVNVFDLVEMSEFARAQVPKFVALQFVSEFAKYFGLVCLEAGLSASVYLTLQNAGATGPKRAA